MDFIKYLKDKTILIVPDSYKKIVLKEKNKLKKISDIKLMSLNELIRKYLFDYDDKAIYYLMNKYNLKYKVASIYLGNLIYIDESHELNRIKQELYNENLLYEDKIFKSYLKNYSIVVYGYDYIPKFEREILIKLNANIIEKKYRNYIHNIYEFTTIDDEITYVANEICKLIDNGVNINNIKLANVNDDYTNVIKRIFNLYNIPILFDDDSLYNTAIGLYFLKNIEDDIAITLDKIKQKYNLNIEENNHILKQIINVLNSCAWTSSYSNIKDILIEKFKKIKINKKLKNCIEIINLKNTYISDEDYVFLISFNQNVIPIIHKDEDYLKDKDKLKYNLETSIELNEIENKIHFNILNDIKNLTITYKLYSYYDEYHISNLNTITNYQVIHEEKSFKNNYSISSNEIELAKKLDNFIQYGTIDDSLKLLYNTHPNIPYLSYDNSYKQINKDDLRNYIKSLRLSYSSINNYYKCGFKYYIANVLKLDTYETTFEAFVGSVFHNVLSKIFDTNFVLENIYNCVIDQELDKINKKAITLKLTEENKFFLDILKEDLDFIIKTIKKQYQNMELDNALYEKYIEIEKDGPIKIVFNGFIDKILFKEKDNITYTVVIDYKTGNETIDLKNVEFGLNMQLPVYLYLLKNYKGLHNIKVVGFYLQKILNKDTLVKDNKTYEELKEEALKLDGYSNSDKKALKLFDKNIEENSIIKSMRIKKDGAFYSTAKVLDDDEINHLEDYVSKKIDEASKDILEAKFDINPKRIDDKNVSCNFCKFKDICYRKEENFIDLQGSNLDFLKGDNND